MASPISRVTCGTTTQRSRSDSGCGEPRAREPNAQMAAEGSTSRTRVAKASRSARSSADITCSGYTKGRRSLDRRPINRSLRQSITRLPDHPITRLLLLPQVSRPRRQSILRLHETLHVALQLELVVARLRRRRRRRRLVRRNPHVPVVLEPGAGRNQPAHRDVLLQAAQVIDLAGDARLRQHTRRFLERRRRDERVGRERRLRNAEQQRPALRRTATLADHALVLLEEPELVDLLVDQELRVPDILDLDPPHHLPRDGLDVLVVDVHALQPVDLRISFTR